MKFLIFALCLVAIAEGVKWEECGSFLGTVKKVDVTGCKPDDETCILKRGTDVVFTSPFEAKADISKLKVSAVIFYNGDIVPLKLSNTDGCKDSGLSCPLKKGTSYTYSQGRLIGKEEPEIEFVIRWKMMDEKDTVVFCWEIKAGFK